MSWHRKGLGIVRLLVHAYEDNGNMYYELLESEVFCNEFRFTKNINKIRPDSDWMEEIIHEGDFDEEYKNIFKDVKEKDFYAEIIADLIVEWGYSEGEYREYNEESWLENENFNILSEEDIKAYEDYNKPDTMDELPVAYNNDFDTDLFFREK